LCQAGCKSKNPENEEYTASDAVGASCMKFNSTIPFSSTNPSNVSNQMNSKHKYLVEEHQVSQNNIKRKWGTGTVDHYFQTEKIRVDWK
jgi:hypothetical protein